MKNGEIHREKPVGCEPEEEFPSFVECTTEHNSGEAVGTDGIANVSVKFNGCKALGTVPCNTPGKAAEEIQVNPLSGKIGYIEKASHSVGVLLEPTATGHLFAEFICEGAGLEIGVGVGNATEGAAYTPEATGGNDGIISPITPVDTMTNKLTQVYTVKNQFEGNIPGNFEGGRIEQLEDYANLYLEGLGQGSSWSKAGQEITNVNTTEGPIEIKG